MLAFNDALANAGGLDSEACRCSPFPPLCHDGAMARIPLVNYDDASPGVRALFDQMGGDPRQQLNVTRLFANHEGFLTGFVAMVRALYTGANLNPRLRELAYLRASQLNDCHY